MNCKRLIPLDLIFSNSKFSSDFSSQSDDIKKYQDVPIINLEPHMRAVKSVLKKDGALDDYWNFYKLMSKTPIADRVQWEKNVKKEINSLNSVFCRKLPVVSKLERDKLVLCEGSLQCCIEKINNKRWIKVLMLTDVAKAWDERSTGQLDKEVEKQGRNEFYTPIYHEKFRKCKISRKGVKRLDMMRCFLGPIHSNLSLLDIGCNIGFYPFHFYRQGFKTTGIDYDPRHLNIALSLKEMYSMDINFKRIKLQDFKAEKKFDIGLGLTVFWHLLGWGDFSTPTITPEELGRKLDELIEHILFWESGTRANEEIALIKNHSNLKYYKKLGNTEATGVEKREFGVFSRLPTEEARDVLQKKS